MSGPRWVECPACNGERGHEVLTGYNINDGSPTGYIEPCRFCGETGSIEIDDEPITIDDLDDDQ
jgi:hypothetical protein